MGRGRMLKTVAEWSGRSRALTSGRSRALTSGRSRALTYLMPLRGRGAHGVDGGDDHQHALSFEHAAPEQAVAGLVVVIATCPCTQSPLRGKTHTSAPRYTYYSLTPREPLPPTCYTMHILARKRAEDGKARTRETSSWAVRARRSSEVAMCADRTRRMGRVHKACRVRWGSTQMSMSGVMISCAPPDSSSRSRAPANAKRPLSTLDSSSEACDCLKTSSLSACRPYAVRLLVLPVCQSRRPCQEGAQRKMSAPQGLYAAIYSQYIYSLYWLYIGPVDQSWPRGTGSVGRGAQGE
jgi:hypothetical protein